MWKKIKLKSRKGMFLMKNGMYIKPIDLLLSDNKKDVIGYCIGENRVISINSSEDHMKWSLDYENIHGLTSYKCPDDDIEGRINMNRIVSHCKKNNISLTRYPAVNYCINYSPGYRDEEWYLPSAGELELFYNINDKFRKDCTISGITTNIIPDNPINPQSFWSSTSYSYNTVFILYIDPKSTYLDFDSKISLCQVLPFLIDK